jgi:hypothetical protein
LAVDARKINKKDKKDEKKGLKGVEKVLEKCVTVWQISGHE